MAPGRHRQRSGGKPKTKGKSSKTTTAGATTTSVHDLPDDILELVFLRLDSCATVVRAASACRRWCVLLADAGFLTRFGSLRARRLAGHYHTVNPFFDNSPPPAGGMPVFVPSPAMATVNPRCFDLDFLPDSKSWEIADSRGGLLLLCKKRAACVWWTQNPYLDEHLVVCEPSTRRHQGILPPGDLVDRYIGLFLLGGGDDNDDKVGCSGGRSISMSNFKIIVVLQRCHTRQYDRGVPVACVFSSGSDGGWRVLQSAASDSNVTIPGYYRDMEHKCFACRAGGSIYWAIDEEDGAMLVLDEAATTFSVVTFPQNLLRSYDRYNFRVTGGEDGALRVVRLLDNELKVFARRRSGHEWVLENLLRLPEATRGLPGREDRFFDMEALIVAADSTHVLVSPHEKTWPFSVDLETMEVENSQERNRYAGTAFPHELPWPPVFLSSAERTNRRSRR